MQGQITTPACITHRNRVNKTKYNSFEDVHVEGIELKILHYEISFPTTTLLAGLWIYLALQFIIRCAVELKW